MSIQPMRSDRTRLPSAGRRALLRLALWIAVGALAALLALVLFARVAAAQEAGRDAGADTRPVLQLEGSFHGLGSADGMRLVIDDAGPSPRGRFIDSNGREAAIGGGWRDGALETVLAFPGRPVFARLAPAALGLQMTVLPLDPDGRPLEREARVLAFLREGVRPPEQPALYMQPPRRADGETDPDVFLASYQFWPPDGVARGFAQIGARYRTMIRFFPQLHADVLWKLCDAPDAAALAAEALRGQGASCRDVARTVETLQSRGRFADWKAAVDRDIAALLPAVQCARGYIVKPEVCRPAARTIADAAVSLQTVSAALQRWN